MLFDLPSRPVQSCLGTGCNQGAGIGSILYSMPLRHRDLTHDMGSRRLLVLWIRRNHGQIIADDVVRHLVPAHHHRRVQRGVDELVAVGLVLRRVVEKLAGRVNSAGVLGTGLRHAPVACLVCEGSEIFSRCEFRQTLVETD
jgi:hypothetical protein